MNWIEVHIDTRPDRLDDLCARLEAAGVTGLVIDDEADFKDFLENNHQYWDYVDDELLREKKGLCRVTFYLSDDAEGEKQLRDAEALLAIYAPYVEETAITFEYEVPSVEAFRARIAHTLATYPYIVAVEDEKIIGYAYVGRLHERAAYDWSVETSIYVDRRARKHGLGRQLYERLEAILRAMNIISVNACIAYPGTMNTVAAADRLQEAHIGISDPNTADRARKDPRAGSADSGADIGEDPYLNTNSPDFHAHLGYQLVGHFHACAYKFDRWYDMSWMEKWIAPHPAKPEAMISFPELPEEVVERCLR